MLHPLASGEAGEAAPGEGVARSFFISLGPGHTAYDIFGTPLSRGRSRGGRGGFVKVGVGGSGGGSGKGGADGGGRGVVGSRPQVKGGIFGGADATGSASATPFSFGFELGGGSSGDSGDAEKEEDEGDGETGKGGMAKATADGNDDDDDDDDDEAEEFTTLVLVVRPGFYMDVCYVRGDLPRVAPGGATGNTDVAAAAAGAAEEEEARTTTDIGVGGRLDLSSDVKDLKGVSLPMLEAMRL